MADARDQINKIEEISKVSKAKGADAAEQIERIAPNKEHFESLMQKDVVGQVNPGIQNETQKVNFMDEIRNLQKKVADVSKASPDTLIHQSQSVIAKIEEVKTKLAQSGTEIQPSSQTLLTNKLSHIDESLKVALNRVGTEFTPADVAAKPSKNPIERFLGFLTHSQYTLERLNNDVTQLGLNKTEMSPATMLSLQMKMGYVTQEIEFFTAILNKSLESTKTIMNVQV